LKLRLNRLVVGKGELGALRRLLGILLLSCLRERLVDVSIPPLFMRDRH